MLAYARMIIPCIMIQIFQHNYLTSTSNLISHLKTYHLLKHEEFWKLNDESQYLTAARSKTDGKSQVSIVDSIRVTQKYE